MKVIWIQKCFVYFLNKKKKQIFFYFYFDNLKKVLCFLLSSFFYFLDFSQSEDLISFGSLSLKRVHQRKKAAHMCQSEVTNQNQFLPLYSSFYSNKKTNLYTVIDSTILNIFTKGKCQCLKILDNGLKNYKRKQIVLWT